MKAKTIKKDKVNNVNNILAVLAIVIVLIAFFNLIMTFIKTSGFDNQINGYAIQQANAYVNITVNTNVGISVGPSSVNWGNGTVNATSGCLNATLITWGLKSNVTCGNWSNATVTGINISNIGNVNCSLNLSGLKNYTTFFGLGATGGMNYSWNISMKEANSCSGGLNNSKVNNWTDRNGDVTLPAASLNYCSNFGFLPSANEMWLDILLVVPNTLNTSQQNTPLSDIINITCG